MNFDLHNELRNECSTRMLAVLNACLTTAEALPAVQDNKVIAFQVEGLTGSNFQVYCYVMSGGDVGDSDDIILEYDFVYKDEIRIRCSKSNLLTSKNAGLFGPERPLRPFETVDFLNFLDANLTTLNTFTIPEGAQVIPKPV